MKIITRAMLIYLLYTTLADLCFIDAWHLKNRVHCRRIILDVHHVLGSWSKISCTMYYFLSSTYVPVGTMTFNLSSRGQNEKLCQPAVQLINPWPHWIPINGIGTKDNILIPS